DNVEWSEEQEASARRKVQENCSQLLPRDKQEDYEVNAKRYWDDFYKIHENGFFKDRHWLFTEFPELAPNRSSSQNGDSLHELSNQEESSNEGLGRCENGLCSLESRTETQSSLSRSTAGLCPQEHRELSQRAGEYPGSAASYRVLEV
ncbi:METL2 protein, partial [Formicarius rufipectus]|nr:METL2 protein [Formicarius rufipectus]